MANFDNLRRLTSWHEPYPSRKRDRSAPLFPALTTAWRGISSIPQTLITRAELDLLDARTSRQASREHIPIESLQTEIESKILDIFLGNGYSWKTFLAAAAGDFKDGYYRKPRKREEVTGDNRDSGLLLPTEEKIGKGIKEGLVKSGEIALISSIPLILNSILTSLSRGQVVIDPNLATNPVAKKIFGDLYTLGANLFGYAGLPFVALRNELRQPVDPEALHWRLAFMAALKKGELAEFSSTLYSAITRLNQAGKLNDSRVRIEAEKMFLLAEIAKRPRLMFDLMTKYLHDSPELANVKTILRRKKLDYIVNYLEKQTDAFDLQQNDLMVAKDESLQEVVGSLIQMELPNLIKIAITTNEAKDFPRLLTAGNNFSKKLEQNKFDAVSTLAPFPYSPLTDAVFSLVDSAEETGIFFVAQKAAEKMALVIPDADLAYSGKLPNAGGQETDYKTREKSAWSSFGVLMNVLKFLPVEKREQIFDLLDQSYRKKQAYKAGEILAKQTTQLVEKYAGTSPKAAEILYTYYGRILNSIGIATTSEENIGKIVTEIIQSLSKKIEGRASIQTSKLSDLEKPHINNLVKLLIRVFNGVISAIPSQVELTEIAAALRTAYVREDLGNGQLLRLENLQRLAIFIKTNFENVLEKQTTLPQLDQMIDEVALRLNISTSNGKRNDESNENTFEST